MPTFNKNINKHSVVVIVVYISFVVILCRVNGVQCTSREFRDECGHTLRSPSGFFRRHFDFAFLKKFFKHWIPFTNSERVKMQFFLYKRDFPECGREMMLYDDDTLELSRFNPDHQTRIIIHGWMSQSKGTFNRAVKNAYMTLALQSNKEVMTFSSNATNLESETYYNDVVAQNSSTEYSPQQSNNTIDFNVIVVDWSVISSNVNYFGVIDLIGELGFLLAEFVRYLHLRVGLHFDDVYLIGHSLGAHIAGMAGKKIQPYRFNTIYALDPAGPKFRDFSDELRIAPTDASYVESIHTSSTLGFEDPVGHATFYPNYGRSQKKCYIYGCSHSRAHKFFAESITSEKGFWGVLCQRKSDDVWLLSTSGAEFRMGGEPSIPKHGTFYVKTNDESPYAMGRRRMLEVE